MTSPNSSYDDIFTTTLEKRSGKLADNVTKGNILLKTLSEKDKIRTFAGGSKILEELEYGEGDMVWYAGYDSITYSPKQLFTAAEYNMKQCAVPVAISGEEELKNSGAEAIIKLYAKRIENAQKTLKNKIGAAIYGDGTASSGKSITGLKALVADDPTSGTVGGINRATATNAFWRNKTLSNELTSANLVNNMNVLYMNCTRGSDHPDLIVTGGAMFNLYETYCQGKMQFTDPKMADAGFNALRYKGVFVVCDNGNCPENKMYMLNTDYIYFRPHKDRNFRVIGGDRMAINQDAKYKLIGWAGNMTMSNAALQGVLINTAASASS